jgi:ABC-type antimicrobial peptide transport system permease subunit
MPERMRRSTAQVRFNTLLLSSLGVAGLVLAAVGIYGVIAYFVAQRTREIGVRMALGATATDVLALVVRQGMAIVMTGVAAGLVGALAAGRVLEALLFQVRSHDPITIASVAAVMIAVSLLASALPARRAARVDPSRALAEG